MGGARKRAVRRRTPCPRRPSWSVCADSSGRRRRVWLGQPHVHTGLPERLPRVRKRSANPVWTWERANRTLALSTASTGRCPLRREGARTGSARCSTVLARLPQSRLPAGPNAYPGSRVPGSRVPGSTHESKEVQNKATQKGLTIGRRPHTSTHDRPERSKWKWDRLRSSSSF